MIGSKPELETKVTNITQYMTEGTFEAIGETGNRLAVGSGLLERLGARVGETLLVSSSSGALVPFKIVASFNLGIPGIDNGTAFGSILDVQKLEKSANRVSDIGVKLNDVSRAEPLAQNWKQFASDKIQSWEEANEGTLSVFTIQTITRNFMTISIVVVAAFGIYNILSIMVTQKRKEIAILRALGFGRKEIVNLFLYQGLILGVLGGVLGLVLGYLICLYMSTLTVGSGRTMGSTGKMLVAFDYMIYVNAIVIAFLSSLVSSFLPAYGAGKLTPIEIIRSE
jgi:lipoprotein-releasing system permease protein